MDTSEPSEKTDPSKEDQQKESNETDKPTNQTDETKKDEEEKPQSLFK